MAGSIEPAISVMIMIAFQGRFTNTSCTYLVRNLPGKCIDCGKILFQVLREEVPDGLGVVEVGGVETVAAADDLVEVHFDSPVGVR